MTVQIPIVITTKPDGFKKVGDDAEKLNQKLNAQAKERLRILDLQAQKEKATSSDVKRSIQVEISARRRGLQVIKIKEQAEKANTRELKQQIAAQKRLNTLTSKLNRSLDEQKQKRTLLGRVKSTAGGGIGGAIAGVGAGVAGLAVGAAALSGTFELAKASEELGRQRQASEKRLRSLLQTTGEYTEIIRQVKLETQGTISETEAAESAFLLLDSGLAASNAEAAQLIATGRTLTSIFEAQGASQEKFTKLLSGGSAALLDNFNLTQAEVTARQELIEASGGLEKGENKLIAIKQLLIEKAEKLQGTVDEATLSTARLDAASNDLQSTIGELLTPSFTSARNASADFLTSTDFSIQSFGLLNETIGEVGLSFDVTFQNLLDMGEGLRTFGMGINSFASAVLTLNLSNSLDLGLERIEDGLTLFGTAAIDAATKDEALGDALTKNIGITEATDAATKELNKTVEESGEVAEAASKAQEDAAQRLEKLNQTRRGFASDILNIEDKSNEDRAEAARTFIDDSIEAQQEAVDTIKQLEEDAAKERVNIGQKLIKDLAQVNKALAKDKSKITNDANKRIKRLEEDTARNSKQDERKRRIDTLGNERLFQFELRQLAADGDALRIQESIERRKIEQEIGVQKRSEEGTAEGEDLQVKIQRIKQDAEDRIREEESSARDRRASLKDRAAEDLIQLDTQLEEQKTAEIENLTERLQALKNTNKERLDNIEETKNESIAKLAEQLVKSKELTESELNNIIPIAKKAGEDAGNAFVSGLEKGFERLQEIENLTGGDIGRSTEEQGRSRRGRRRSSRTPSFADGVLNFGGGEAMVGERGPEKVLLPRGSSVIPNGGINISIPVSIQGGGSADEIEAIVQRNVQVLVNDLENALGT